MHGLPIVPGCRAERVSRAGFGRIVVSAQRRRSEARCPTCQHPSSTVHSYYRRRPADLPAFGHEVRLELRTRRLYCRNSHCRRRTFAEPMPALVAPRAQRTQRLARAQTRVVSAVGAEAGSRLSRHLAMPTSADTLLRLVRQAPLPEHPTPRVLGVDDWALKKRCSYGTILVDLERRCAVDLLPDRSAETLASWLADKHGIGVIARDRSPEYARGAAQGAPAAVQVADRWHLLFNTRQMVERWAAGAHARLQRLPALPDEPKRPLARTRAFLRARPDAVIAADSRVRCLVRYDEVRRRYLAGETLLAIARATGLARGTVRRYAYVAPFPERAVRAPEPSIIDPYLPYLEARVTDGCENAAQLWREIREQGFRGVAQPIRRWLQERRTAPSKYTSPSRRDRPETAHRQATALMPSPKQLAWLLVKPPKTRTPEEVAVLARLDQDKEAAMVATLVQRFPELGRACSISRNTEAADALAVFDAWSADATLCGVRAVETFAVGLQDNAVRAALTMEWSNGQTEGQVTKLKLLKRQMYGRGSLDLLRRRLLLAA